MVVIFSVVLMILSWVSHTARADFVLDMTLCRPPSMTTCEDMSLLVRRGIWVCRLGAPKIIAKVEAMNLSTNRAAKWKLKRYECRSVPNGTKI